MLINTVKSLLSIVLSKFRKPGKAVLFFLLMAASCMLLVLGAGLFLINKAKMEVIDRNYTTIGMVEQPDTNVRYVTTVDPCVGSVVERSDVYDGLITPEELDYPGADYVNPPETRPYCLAYMPELNQSSIYSSRTDGYIVEFTPLESYNDQTPTLVQISRVLFRGNQLSYLKSRGYDIYDINGTVFNEPEPGTQLYLCQHLADAVQLQAGRTYIANIRLSDTLLQNCSAHHGIFEFELDVGPYSTEYDASGKLIDSQLPGAEKRRYAEEVTEDFYDPGGHGERWLEMCKLSEMQSHIFPVLTINSFDLIPTCRQGNLEIRRGREISESEFEEGAKVCLVSQNFAVKNLIYEGDKIKLSMLCV